MSLTRKELIIEKYENLQNVLIETYQIEGLFPSLEDVDVPDLLYFFNLKFTKDDENFRKAKVREMATFCGVEIKEEQFEEAFKIINTYIDFLKDIQIKKK